MIPTVEFQRHPGCTPGTWWWTTGECGPTMSCPKCQHLHIIDLRVPSDDHGVGPDGLVTPSCVCQRCGWHANAKLMGWTGKPCV